MNRLIEFLHRKQDDIAFYLFMGAMGSAMIFLITYMITRILNEGITFD